MAWHEHISSIARTLLVFLKISMAFLAAIVPIDTWSSWFPEDGIESTLAGCASNLFSDTSAAALYCTIINPELTPPDSTKNAGRPLRDGLTILSSLLSEISAISARAIPRKSKASATGCPWKLPPEIPSSDSGKIKGLSVTEFISISTFSFMNSKASLLAPCTCGVHLREYASWILPSPCFIVHILPSSIFIMFEAVFICPLCGRKLWIRGSRTDIIPCKASNVRHADKSAASMSFIES